MSLLELLRGRKNIFQKGARTSQDTGFEVRVQGLCEDMPISIYEKRRDELSTSTKPVEGIFYIY